MEVANAEFYPSSDASQGAGAPPGLAPNLDSSLASGMISWRQKQRQAREEAILDAAREMIAEQGYDAMTMEDLAERVGISKPTLYQHFPSKEALAVRAVVAQMENSLQSMRESVPGQSASDRMTRVVRQMIGGRFNCANILHSSTKAALAPIVRAHPDYQKVRAIWLRTLTEIMDDAKLAGAIDPTLSTRALIQMLTSVMRDTEYDELIKNGECGEDEVRETLCAIYLTGLQKSSKTNE